MAEAITETVTLATIIKVTLTLSKEEAEVLDRVLIHVGGSGNTTRRRHVDAILHALNDAGISDDTDDCNGSVYFE